MRSAVTRSSTGKSKPGKKAADRNLLKTGRLSHRPSKCQQDIQEWTINMRLPRRWERRRTWSKMKNLRTERVWNRLQHRCKTVSRIFSEIKASTVLCKWNFQGRRSRVMNSALTMMRVESLKTQKTSQMMSQKRSVRRPETLRLLVCDYIFLLNSWVANKQKLIKI